MARVLSRLLGGTRVRETMIRVRVVKNNTASSVIRIYKYVLVLVVLIARHRQQQYVVPPEFKFRI